MQSQKFQGSFPRNLQADCKIYLEMQKFQNSQNNILKEEQSWNIFTSQF